MIGKYQYRKPSIIKIPIHIYPVKIPFCLPDRIKLKEIIHEKIVGGTVNHLVILKIIKRIMKKIPWQKKINGANLFVNLIPATLRIEWKISARMNHET